MTVVIIPDRRLEDPGMFSPRVKPKGLFRINYAHPLAQDLGFYVCPNEAVGYREMVKGYEVGTVTGSPKGHGEKGMSYEGDSVEARQHQYAVGTDFGGTDQITIAVHWQQKDDAPNVDSYLVGKYRAGGTFGDWQFKRVGNESYFRYISFILVAGGVSHDVGNSAFKRSAEYTDYVAIGRYDGSLIDLWEDGELIDSEAASGDMPVQSYAVNLIGADRVSAATGNHHVYSVGVWERALSDAEILTLSHDPYQFLIPG